MKDTEVKIKCYKCGNEYMMDMMRMDPNGKNLVCRNCLDRKPLQATVGKMPQKMQSSSQFSAKSSPGAKPSEAKTEYFCKECRYSFSRSARLDITTCPYCGSGALMQKSTASRILADASRMKGD